MSDVKYEKIIYPQTFFNYHFDNLSEKEPVAIHWHEHIEFLQSIRGYCDVYINAEKHTLTPGDILIINQGEPHSLYPKQQTVHRCLLVDNMFFTENDLNIQNFRFNSLIKDPVAFDLFSSFFDSQKNDNFSLFRARTKFMNFITYCCDNYISDSPKSSMNAIDYIKRGIIYIQNHYKEPLTLESVANNVGISKYHFSREFHKLTGQSFTNSLNIIRCEQAKKLLKKDITITELGLECGFKDSAYFSRVFKQIYNVSPSQWRESLKNEV